MTIGGQRACVAWLLDPQAQSVPQWVGKVDVTALGPVASMLALRAAWQALRVRSANQGRMQWRDSKGRLMTGKGWFDPTPEYPLWLIVLDEAHMLLTDAQYSVEAAYLISNIAKLGRKTGCSMLLASQLSSLSELKDRAVRAMLAGMGAIALRSGENLSAGMIGIEGNAFTLPQIPGLGYTNGPDARPGAWFKATWTGDAERTYDIAEAQQPCSLDEQTREAIRLVAASPKTTAGPKTWMPSWHYSGNGQVLRDAD